MTKILLSASALIIGMQAAAFAQGMDGAEVVSDSFQPLERPVEIQRIYVPERLPARGFPQGSTNQVNEMENFIYNIGEAEGIVDVFYTDMSGDGQAEALVIMDDCDHAGACSWRLYAHRGGNIAIVGGDRAGDISFAGTHGGGAVVWSDGVTWAYSGYSAYPFGSVLDTLRSYPGAATDLEVLNAQSDFRVVDAGGVDVFVADFLPDLPGAERFYRVSGLENSYGMEGHPYALADAGGRLIDHGFSLDYPSIFAREDGGLTIFTNGPHGLSATVISGDGGDAALPGAEEIFDAEDVSGEADAFDADMD